MWARTSNVKTNMTCSVYVRCGQILYLANCSPFARNPRFDFNLGIYRGYRCLHFVNFAKRRICMNVYQQLEHLEIHTQYAVQQY